MTGTPTNITAVVTIFNDTRDCFFCIDGNNWSPGWVVGEIKLPLALYSNIYKLVWSVSMRTYWVAGNRVKYRGECHNFDYHYFQNFDWGMVKNFPKIDADFIPSPENTWQPSNKPILKGFRSGEDHYF